jgi:DNA-binding LytR/AlgR family response regulator
MRSHPDLAIIDIELMDKKRQMVDGVQVAKQLQLKSPITQVIFVSSFISHCTDVYDVAHIYFIPKKSIEENFPRAFKKATAAISELDKKVLLVKNRDIITKVRYCDILYIENDARKIKVKTVAGVEETYESIDKLGQTLDERFVHCHKSFIVNMDFVKYMEKKAFHLKTGEVVFISQTKFADTKDKFISYMQSSLKRCDLRLD